MRTGSVVAFMTIDVLLVLTPGPDWAYVFAVGLRDGMVIPAVGGLVAGYGVLTAVVAAGLAVLITTTQGALTAVTLVGGAYLIWLGSGIVSRPVDGDAPGPATGPRRIPATTAEVAVRGMATSGLNPKGLLLFVAVLPQFVDRHGGLPVAIQISILGAIHAGSCAIVYLGLGTLARKMLAAHPRAAHAVTRAAGAAMIVVGALLLLERAVTGAL